MQRHSALRTAFLACGLVAMLTMLAVPAAAQTAETARGEAFGVQVDGDGVVIVDFGPAPQVEANLPPGEREEADLIVVDADPAAFSATLHVEAEAREEATIEATLQEIQDNPNLPEEFNARGFARTEEFSALDGNLTADVLTAEAVAFCDGEELVLGAGSDVLELTLGGEVIDIIGADGLGIITGERNQVLFDNEALGLRIVAFETNYDGETGTTDGSDTVFVNALRVTVTEGGGLATLLGGPQDIIVSHAEATATCPAAADIGDPLENITKTASSDTVAPGDTFTYTIVVPNSSDTCTLTDVRVEDTITGPGSVTATDPEADDVNRDGDTTTVVFNDIGPIEPGDSETLTITVQVDDDAQDGAVFEEDLDVTALCDGEPVDGGVDFDGPTVVDDDGDDGPPPPARRLPETGGGALAMIGGVLALAGYGLFRFGRRQ